MRNLYRSSKAATTGALALGLLCQGSEALAACANRTQEVSNDLALECLIGPRKAKEPSDPTFREQTMYRTLISELSAVMALPVLEPADSVGFSGFHFSFDVTGTTIKSDRPYWGGYAQADGTKSQAGVRNVSGNILGLATLMVRKGIWPFVIPIGAELGLGASNLLQSNIYALQGYFKLAFHEGYHDIPVPSIAARASVSRIAGAPQLDLTMINVDGQMSKAFGIGGTWTLEPYIGGGAMFSIARSQVIDTAPTIDLYRLSPGVTMVDALNQKVVYPTQDNIFRYRLFAGINAHYAIISITGYFSYWGVGADNGFDLSTIPDAAVLRPASGAAAACRINGNTMEKICPKDLAADQFTFGGSLGLRF